MSTPPLDRYDRVYTAAAQMLWSQHGTYMWRGTSWPADRSAVWTALEQELTTGAARAAAVLRGPDPAHHLVSRSTPGGRPVTLPEAAADWKQRLALDQGITTVPKPSGYAGIAPEGAVVLSPGWLSWLGRSVFTELDTRLAPGRPAVTIGSHAQPLADLMGTLAAQFRAPLAQDGPPPSPLEEAPPLRQAGGSGPDHGRLFTLARAAAEQLPPSRRDFSVSRQAEEAAQRLLGILGGEDIGAWQEPTEGADPAHQLVQPAVTAATLEAEAESLREAFADYPLPRRPHAHEVLEDFEDPVEPTTQERLALMSPTLARVTAEVLEEFAARLTPGHHTGQILFDAYPVCAFLRRLHERLQML